MTPDTSDVPIIAEKGRTADGEATSLDKRLFMQLLVFSGCQNIESLIPTLDKAGFDSVLYADINDPHGVGLLTMSEDPSFFVTTLRTFLNASSFVDLKLKPDYTMMGRTYTRGYETDIDHWLLKKPRVTVLNADWPWAIWYPLRRSGSFATLSADAVRDILMEHGKIGMAFGRADFAHDIRLAAYGLDKYDNDFVIGLVGKRLDPLSILVQTMRKTRQTSEFIERLGPFFIGRAVRQSTL